MTRQKIAVYPGTFDPVTNGHFDIIKRATKIFDLIIVSVSATKDKSKTKYSQQERIEMMKIATADFDQVTVHGFDTLTVDFVKKMGSKTIVRGLRAVSDFEFEMQMSYANESLSPDIDTIYLMPTLQCAFISSSVVRTILDYNGDPSHLLPMRVWEYIQGHKCT